MADDQQNPPLAQAAAPREAVEKSSVRYLTVGAEHAGQRVDNYLRTELKGAPKSLVYRILRTGEVRVNKGRAKPDTRLALGDVVRIPPLRLSEETPVRISEALGSTLEQAILHQDDNILVLNKPAGLAVHAGSGVHVGAIEALRVLFPDLPGLELAHRLDRETSGVLVFAKHRPALMVLHGLFRDDRVKKAYLALVHGAFPDGLREVDAPLEKNTLRGGERMVEVRGDGKPSQTRFRVLRRFADTTLIEAMPVTGRTHQIRVHAAHAGFPLVGDAKYGDPARDKALRRFGPLRLFLHAASLRLPSLGLGDAKKELRIEAPLADDLARFLTLLGEARGSAREQDEEQR
jgi:23S rRNA pseudouridine955/2504/2580 synthase